MKEIPQERVSERVGEEIVAVLEIQEFAVEVLKATPSTRPQSEEVNACRFWLTSR